MSFQGMGLNNFKVSTIMIDQYNWQDIKIFWLSSFDEMAHM